jgi:hypothetical protein
MYKIEQKHFQMCEFSQNLLSKYPFPGNKRVYQAERKSGIQKAMTPTQGKDKAPG